VAEAEGVATAGCRAGDVAEADAAADEEAADVLEVTGFAAGDDKEDAEEHPATPAPATTAAAPTAARRLASLIELNIANPYLWRAGAAACTMSRNLAVYTPFKDDVRLAMVSERL
jgi:hypothetical protein